MKDNQYKIHYDGWGSEWDEWVGPIRIKTRPPDVVMSSPSGIATPSTSQKTKTTTGFQTGVKVRVVNARGWGGNLEGKIIKVVVGSSTGTFEFMVMPSKTWSTMPVNEIKAIRLKNGFMEIVKTDNQVLQVDWSTLLTFYLDCGPSTERIVDTSGGFDSIEVIDDIHYQPTYR